MASNSSATMAALDSDAPMAEIEDLVRIASATDSNVDQDDLVSAIDSVLDKLIVIRMALYAQISANKIGVHRSNRYGLGIVGSWMPQLGLQITRMGHDPSARAECTAIPGRL